MPRVARILTRIEALVTTAFCENKTYDPAGLLKGPPNRKVGKKLLLLFLSRGCRGLRFRSSKLCNRVFVYLDFV